MQNKLTATDYIELFLLVSLPIFSFIAFSSLSAYWVQAPYDAWRIYEIFILLSFSAFLIFSKNNVLDLFNSKTSFWLKNTLFIIVILIAVSCYFAQYSQRALADTTFYFLLAVTVYAQAIILKKHPDWAAQIAAWLAVLPMLSLIFLPIALFDIWHGRPGTWTQSFTNIRMLDDALLPCLLLLWARPAWLAVCPEQNKWKSWTIHSLVFIVSTIYLLSFLFHGARAALFALSIGLAFIIIFRCVSWKKLILPFGTIIAASTIFFLFKKYQIASGSKLIRSGTSGRTELWEKAIKLWSEQPIWGIGGNHFSLYPPNYISAHPHNILIQWFSEWGLAGVLVFLLLCPLVYTVFKYRCNISPFILAAVVALAVNALFSGVLVYPVSQILALFPLAWAMAQLPTAQTTYHYKTISPSIKILIVVISIALLSVHYKDLFCKDCMSADWHGAPRFWDAGRASHLIPYDIEKMGKAPTEY